MAISKTMKRMLRGTIHDPLGLDERLQDFVMAGGGFKFSKPSRKLAMRLIKDDVRQRDPTIFHASAAGDCRRKQILGIRYPDQVRVDPLEAVQRMGDGKWGHLKWQLVFHQMGLLTRAEFKVRYQPWNAGGSPDGILILPWLDKKTEFLLEVKTVSDRRFGEILRTGRPERNHVLQTHTYIQALDISNIIYWYENKNTNDWLYFWEKRDLATIQFLRKRYAVLNKRLAEGRLGKPDCTFQMNDYMYRNCHYKKTCIKLLKEDGTWTKYKPD